MSYSNILRLLTAALKDGEAIDLAFGEILKILPKADDTGEINIGDGTNSIDVQWFGSSANNNVLFDVGNDIVTFDGIDIALGDMDLLVLGDGRDLIVQWDGSSGAVTAGDGAMWVGCPSKIDPRFNTVAHEYFNDFRAVAADLDVTNEWTYTETGAGGAAALTADATCGTMTLTTDALDNDACNLVLNQMSFKLAAGKKLWFETKVKITTAAKHIQSDWAIGMIYSEDLKAVADNMPGDGIVFHKDDGDANIDFSSSDNGTNTQSAAVATCASETWITLGFYFDGGASGSATVTPYVNGVAGAAISSVTYATHPECCPVFMFRNGEAGAVVLTIDYVRVVQLR